MSKGTDEFLDKEDVHASIESWKSTLLRVVFLETVYKATIEDKLASTSVELLTTLHSIEGIEQERKCH